MASKRAGAAPGRLSLGALLLMLLTGCGGSGRASVEGKVTLDGQPVDGGRIMFIPLGNEGNQRVFANAMIVEGKFELDADHGPNLGRNKVEIVWYRTTGRKVKSSDLPELVDERVQIIPDAYNAYSNLAETLKPGLNTLNYELRSDAISRKPAPRRKVGQGN